MKEFFITTFIILSILFVVFILNPNPPFKKTNEKARARACAANMRVMTGVIEMYNLDRENSLKFPEYEMFQTGGDLIKLGYLKAPIIKPAKECSYNFTGDFSVIEDVPGESGVIFCSFHGSAAEVRNRY